MVGIHLIISFIDMALLRGFSLSQQGEALAWHRRLHHEQMHLRFPFRLARDQGRHRAVRLHLILTCLNVFLYYRLFDFLILVLHISLVGDGRRLRVGNLWVPIAAGLHLQVIACKVVVAAH